MRRQALMRGIALCASFGFLMLAPQHVSAQLEPPAVPIKMTVAGKVIDETGQPVAAATVSLQGGPSTEFFNAGPVITDKEGRFQLSGINTSRQYLLRIEHADLKLAAATKLQDLRPQPDSSVVAIPPVTLQRMGTVAGDVLIDDHPRAGIEVSASVQMELDGETVGYPLQSTKTGDDGRYSFLVTPIPTLNVVASVQPLRLNANSVQSGPHAVPPGGTIRIPPMVMQLLQGFIGGVIVDLQGQPVPNARLEVSPADRAAARYWGGTGTQRLGPDGRFRFDGLPTTKFRLLVLVDPPANSPDRRNRFPAMVFVDPNQADVQVVYDTTLRRTLPTRPRRDSAQQK